STGGGSREYYGNGEVGDAMITVDPDTRRLVIITDEETSQYISQVVSNLDRPRPQVLIKVVFLEVTHRISLDIGVEGGGTRQINGSTSRSEAGSCGLQHYSTRDPKTVEKGRHMRLISVYGCSQGEASSTTNPL